MLRAWQAGSATVVVALLTSGLIGLDLGDGAFRRWWATRAFTTDAVAGILVVLITVLVVNQLLRIRQQRERSRAIGAQAAMLLRQAIRATTAVTTANSSDSAAAADEVRTYMTMLLIAAPILIDAKAPRAFLEQGQALGGQLLGTLDPAVRRYYRTGRAQAGLDEAVQRLKIAAFPLLTPLAAEERTAVGAGETDEGVGGIREP